LSARPARTRWVRDWRTWLGLIITGLALAFALRGVDPREVGRSIAAAEPGLVAAMVPITLLGLFLRGVRWRYLLRPLAERPLPLGALFRATLVGFAATNLFPLRIGELVRPWFLARETGVRGPAALGTLLLERAIDFTCVAALGAGVLLATGEAMPAWPRQAALVFAGLAAIPYLMVLALRLDEPRTLRALAALCRPLPAALGERALDLVTQVCHGLLGLRGPRAVLAVALWSVALWAGVFALPFGLGLLAFHVELPPRELALATYAVTVFTALAATVPAAPGFFGVFHFACREALALFGVSSAVGVAYGTVLHLAYWVPVTLGGLWVSFGTGTRLDQLANPDGR
jgi:hypothetical protein